MRRRIVVATVTVAVAGILVFGLPLLVVARRVVHDDEVRRLDREADSVAFAVQEDVEAGRPVSPGTIAGVARSGRYVVVVDPQQRRTVVGAPIAGRSISAEVRTLSATVRLQASARHADERTVAATAVVLGLAAAGVAVAVALAVLVARRLVRPLSGLAEVSTRIGAGDFSARADGCGIAEADAVALALNATARRIEDLLEAERSFSANASHQLRTPLTAIRIHVEELAGSSDPGTSSEARTALAEVDRLDGTIADLLTFARRGRSGRMEDLDVTGLLDGRSETWRRLAATLGRQVLISSEPGCRARTSAPSVGQTLDALVDNSLRHGAGEVTVTARTHGRYAEITVFDEGHGIPAGAEGLVFERHLSLNGGTGVGLSLARALVESEGGRLDLVCPRPPKFRILLPAP